MSKKLRNYLFLTGKLVIAAALLGWALNQVHWNDYVVTNEGESCPVIDPMAGEPDSVRVLKGLLGLDGPAVLKLDQLQPIVSDDRHAARQAAGDKARFIRKGFASSLIGLRYGLLACAAVGFLLSLLVVAVRWRFLLAVQDVHIGRWESVRLTFLGQFFNAIVPGVVGGDLVKAWYVSKHTPKKAAALVGTFVDRVMGLAELSLMAAVMVAVVFFGRIEPYQKIRGALMATAIVLVVLALTVAFVLSRRFRRVFHLQGFYRRLPIAHHIAAAGEAAIVYRHHIGALLEAVLMTVVAHILFIGPIALVGLSLQLNTPWYSYFVYAPLIYIIGSVPLTPGGVGLIEKLYVGFFSSPVCGASEIVALALLSRLIPMLWGLPGLIVAVTGPKLPKAETLQAELGLAAHDETQTAANCQDPSHNLDGTT